MLMNGYLSRKSMLKHDYLHLVTIHLGSYQRSIMMVRTGDLWESNPRIGKNGSFPISQTCSSTLQP